MNVIISSEAHISSIREGLNRIGGVPERIQTDNHATLPSTVVIISNVIVSNYKYINSLARKNNSSSLIECGF